MLLADHLDRPAVGQRLVDGEIQACVGRLHRRSIERTAPVLRLRPPARGTDVGRPVGAVLHEQQLDATVGRRQQRLLPAGRGASAPRSLFTPAQKQLVLPAGTPTVEQRPSGLEQARRIDVRLGRGPTEQCSPHLGRKQALEAGPRLLRPDEHHAGSADSANTAIECVRDFSEVPVDDRLDVALVASLRPAALVVAAGNLRRLVGEGTQLTAAEPVDVAAFAPDVGDDGAVTMADATNERRELELLAETSLVGDRPRQQQRPEQAVELGGEGRDTTNSLPAELAPEPGRDAIDVARNGLPLRM